MLSKNATDLAMVEMNWVVAENELQKTYRSLNGDD